MKNLFKMIFWFDIMSLRYEKVSIVSIIWILPGIFTKTTFLLFFLHRLSLKTLKPTSCHNVQLNNSISKYVKLRIIRNSAWVMTYPDLLPSFVGIPDSMCAEEYPKHPQ